MEKPKKNIERKIGSTTYIVSSYRTSFSAAAVKQKVSKLIKTEAVKRK